MTPRRPPPDIVAFVVIVVCILATHLPVMMHGMCFNDPTWYFHFGHRVNQGAVPYRDFVFQVGPLPIYVDAGFQQVFGAKYVASLLAGLSIKTLRVYATWLVARRLAGVLAAALVATYCVLDPRFGFVHHWSTPYAELFATLAGLFFVLAVRAEGRKQLVHLAAAGAMCGLVMSARQSAFAAIAVLLAGSSAISWLRRKWFGRRQLFALWAGVAAGVAVVLGALAMLGALGPAIQQMFIDAPAKKAVHGLPAVLDAVSGGAMVDWRYGYLTGFLHFLGISSVLCAVAAMLGRSSKPIAGSTIALLLVPATLCIANLTRDAELDLAVDLPRTFLEMMIAFAVISPSRLRAWFGVEPVLAIALAGLPLACDWAIEMSTPGRGWSWADVWGLVTATLLIALASNRLSLREKQGLCAAFAAAAVAHACVAIARDRSPFNKPESTDGVLADSVVAPGHPMLEGIRLPAWRARALVWLASRVRPGSTCFVYANMPSLYDLLDCTNPTAVDTTIADFPSGDDARRAIAALRAHPPDFIIAHDRMWMSPPIDKDLGGKIENYESWNPDASFTLHMGLRSIIDQYESLGTVGDALGASARVAADHWDVIDAIHVYRRR